MRGALYEERRLLTATGKDIKNKEEILTLLDAVWEPEKTAVIHCRGHQKRTARSRGNRLADRAAKRATEEFGGAGGGIGKTSVLNNSPTVYPGPRPAV